MFGKTSTHLQGVILIALAGICWGSMANFMQFIFAEKTIDPASLSVIRLLASGVVMVAGGALIMGRRLFASMMRPKDAFDIILNGLIVFGAHYGFICTIYYANAGVATIVLALVPLFAGLWTCIRERRLVSLREVICFVLAFGGVTFIVTAGDFSKLSISPLGLLFSAVSVGFATVGSIQPRGVLQRVGVFPVLCWGMLFGGIGGAIFHPLDFSEYHWQTSTLLAFAYIVLVGTVIAFACYFAGLKRVTPVMAGLLNCMEPLSAYVFLILFMGLTLNLWELTGIVAVLSNVVLLALWKRKD